MHDVRAYIWWYLYAYMMISICTYSDPAALREWLKSGNGVELVTGIYWIQYCNVCGLLPMKPSLQLLSDQQGGVKSFSSNSGGSSMQTMKKKSVRLRAVGLMMLYFMLYSCFAVLLLTCWWSATKCTRHRTISMLIGIYNFEVMYYFCGVIMRQRGM